MTSNNVGIQQCKEINQQEVVITPDFRVKCMLFPFQQDYLKETRSKIAPMDKKT